MGTYETLHTADGFRLMAYRAQAAGNKKPAAIVVLQEIFGVNHHIRAVTDRFATLGYEAIAPALFDRAERDIDLGYDDHGVEVGRNLRGRIGLDATMSDITAAVAAVSSAGPVAVIGYCWGGSLAFLAATRLPGVACVVGYYGGMIAAHADEKPRVPVQLHFGEQDEGIPLSDVEKIRQKRLDIEIFTYPADHGFNCDERDEFHQSSSDLALERTLTFLARHLKA